MAERVEYTNRFMDFFTFEGPYKPDSKLRFGYGSEVADFSMLERYAEYDGGSNEKTGFTKVTFCRNKWDEIRRALANTARELYNIPEDDSVRVHTIEQSEACTTNPFRVEITSGNMGHTFYLKKPDARRAVGKALYNLITDKEGITYRFNEVGFAASQVPGEEIQDEDKKDLIWNPDFVKELIKLNVFTNLIFLEDILRSWTNANCSFSQEHGIYLFDFDRAFMSGEYSIPYSDKHIRQSVDIFSVEREEKRKIHRNLRHQSQALQDLLEAADEQISDRDVFDLAWKNGANTLGEAIAKRFDKIGQWR